MARVTRQGHVTTPDERGLEGDLGWSLRAISIAFQAGADGTVAEIPGGARGYLALVAVESETSRTQLAIARRLGIDKTPMTYLIDTLVEAGLVERRVDARDRRARIVALTEAGAAALRVARERLRVTEERLLAPLRVEQREQFRQMASTIAVASQEAPEATGGCDTE